MTPFDKRIPKELWERVDFTTDGCWVFMAGSRSRDGYGRLYLRGMGQTRLAHRVAYEAVYGPIRTPCLDHLCRVRMCVNPDHLEPTTMRENTLRGYGPGGINARKTHCPQGHKYEPENLYPRPDGSRQCKECQRTRCRERYRRNAARSAT